MNDTSCDHICEDHLMVCLVEIVDPKDMEWAAIFTGKPYEHGHRCFGCMPDGLRKILLRTHTTEDLAAGVF